MAEPHESPLPIAAMQASFGQHFRQKARFREDTALLEALAQELDPVLEALHLAFSPPEHGGQPALHEAYALLSLLGRRAALLDATPGVALLISEGVIRALRDVGLQLSEEHASELAIVAVEGYAHARDERITRELREVAAKTQVSILLGPRCLGVFLAGRHEEAELTPVLERIARELLREDARSVLLDLSRLQVIDEEIARALGRFCGSAATLGVASFVFGASAELRSALDSWSKLTGTSTFVDDFQRAHSLALASAGLRIRPVRSWLGLIGRRPYRVAR